MWNFHVDYLQGNHRYDMILGRDILSELKIDLCFSDNTIKGNLGTCKGSKSPIKDGLKINSTFHPIGLNTKSFGMKRNSRAITCWTPHVMHIVY